MSDAEREAIERLIRAAKGAIAELGVVAEVAWNGHNDHTQRVSKSCPRCRQNAACKEWRDALAAYEHAKRGFEPLRCSGCGQAIVAACEVLWDDSVLCPSCSNAKTPEPEAPPCETRRPCVRYRPHKMVDGVTYCICGFCEGAHCGGTGRQQ